MSQRSLTPRSNRSSVRSKFSKSSGSATFAATTKVIPEQMSMQNAGGEGTEEVHYVTRTIRTSSNQRSPRSDCVQATVPVLPKGVHRKDCVSATVPGQPDGHSFEVRRLGPQDTAQSPPAKRAKSPREFDLRSPPRVQAPVYRAAPIGSPPLGGGRSVEGPSPRYKAPPKILTARLPAERSVQATVPSPSASAPGVQATVPRDGASPSNIDKVSSSHNSDLEAEIRDIDQHLDRERRQLQKEKIKARQLKVKRLEQNKKRLNDSLTSRSSRDSRSFCGAGDERRQTAYLTRGCLSKISCARSDLGAH